MKNKILMAVISAMIVVVLCGSVLAPVLSSTTDKIVVQNNLGHRATLVTDAESVETGPTIALTYATPSITINGESIEGTDGEWYDVLITDELSVHYQWNTPATISITVYSVTQGKGSIDVIAQDFTASISGTTLGYAFSTFNLSRTVSWYSYLDAEGDHVNALMYAGIPLTTVYVRGMEDIRGYTINEAFDKTFAFVGETVKVNKVGGSGSADDLTATCTLADYSKTSEIKTFEVGRQAGTYTIVDGSATNHPYSFVLPYEITADNTLTQYSGLLGAILPLAIIGGLLGMVAIVIRRE